MMPKSKTAILWFRNNLRLHDNPIIEQALNEFDKVIPIYIWEDRFFENDSFGHKRMGPHREFFLKQTLENLKLNLESVGLSLIIQKGNPLHIFHEKSEEYSTDTIYSIHEYTYEEKLLEEIVSQRFNLILIHDRTLFPPSNLPMVIDKLPSVFTDWREKVEPILANLFLPSDTIRVHNHHPSSDTHQAQIFSNLSQNHSAIAGLMGGEDAAIQHLNNYIWNSENISSYKETRNELIGKDYSTKFSLWLANGSISPRYIYQQVKIFEKERIENKSTYWVIFELLWRDYFKFVVIKHREKIFYKSGIKGKHTANTCYIDDRFELWKKGQTKSDFVNANMNELAKTGFMSNRGRQNVASYLVHDLHQDWRAGASWFESMLIDYDPCSNYGNWNYIAGIGNDPRPNRKFNVKTQSARYDPDGSYISLWT